MQYIKLARLYEELESTAKKLEKSDILAGFYKHAADDDLAIVTMMSMGIVETDIDLGIASQMMIRVIAKTYGIPEKEIIQKLKETGDLGLVAEYFAKNKEEFIQLKIEALQKLWHEKGNELTDQLEKIFGPFQNEKVDAYITTLYICDYDYPKRYFYFRRKLFRRRN